MQDSARRGERWERRCHSKAHDAVIAVVGRAFRLGVRYYVPKPFKVAEIVAAGEALAGRVWVESKEGEGSAFSFILPTTNNVQP